MDNASKPLRPKPSLHLVTSADSLSPKGDAKVADSEKPELKSALAHRLTTFADDLDRHIALLLAE